MLPVPGAPSSSWPVFRAKLVDTVNGATFRVCSAFWLFGVINNVLYVIILAAALDLVGPAVPKGVVLLADVVPSFVIKLLAPYVIDAIPYRARVLLYCALSATGMLLVAVTPSYTEGGSVSTKLAGVVLASISSGAGELSFLGLTHYYGPLSLAAWGSGTGAAGLIGAGAYATMTTVFRISVKSTLLASAFLPSIMFFSFFFLLPLGPLDSANYQSLRQDDEGELDGLLTPRRETWFDTFKANLKRSRRLFFPFMLPLLFVYVAEYTINQGVSPTLLFPLETTPFRHYRAFYPLYAATYQVLNLVILTAHAIYNFLPNVYFVFAIIFWEGLLGGLVYVNTFAEILDTVPREDREFSLGAATVSDSGGICIAGFVGMALEVALCSYQVAHGRDYCKRS